MILSTLRLKNFRLHKNTSLNFSEELNYIVGGNGQGKTSVLEAIYYLCTTKGYNSKSDSEVVTFNENDFEVSGVFEERSKSNLRVYYSSDENRKYYFQNEKNVGRSSEIIGQFPVVILTPADHSITQGSPGERRKFIDSIISQSSRTYLKYLIDYNKTLRQRSSLLSLLKEKRTKNIFDELDAWTDKLVIAGTEIIKRRLKFIEEFNEYIKNSYNFIMETSEIPSVFYSYLNSSENENIEEEFRKELNDNREDELRRATNLIGPHRDDFIFEVNNLNLRTYGSQGQHKTFQVALRFAQFFYLKEITGITPIFLLDDVFGELDTNRSQKINNYLREVGQTFITLTDFTNISYLKRGDKDTVIKLNKGVTTYA